MDAVQPLTGQDEASCHASVISLEAVGYAYEKATVIDNLTFSIRKRDFVGLIGSNGAGKTTLLKMIVGLLKPQQGKVRLFGQELSTFKQWERVGYVPQKNALNPLFPATVQEVVLSGLYGRNRMFRRITRHDHERCFNAMQALEIEQLAERKIGQLSGGQQQRAFLARALINNPELLILDEPFVGIDAQTQESFFHMLRHMHQQHDMTFLMVSHDMEMIHSYLGEQPLSSTGKLNFYVKHSHDLPQCSHTDLTHSLKELRDRRYGINQEGSGD